MLKREGKPDLQAMCAKLAADMGYELVDAGFEKEHTGLYLRVYLDSRQGITLQDCESFHRRLLPLVEEVTYDFLEVSSPGIDRPIKRASEAGKAVGSQVEIKLFKPMDGSKLFTGIFQGLDEAGYHLLVQGQEKVFPAAAVALARRTIDVERVLQEKAQEDQHEQSES
ncbi:MAG: ribosome maturation factor RimP [Christensenellales bacterium]